MRPPWVAIGSPRISRRLIRASKVATPSAPVLAPYQYVTTLANKLRALPVWGVFQLLVQDGLIIAECREA
jgi:hypothetical protein